MKLAVLGSGSRGNAIALATDDGTILIDAGFGPRTLVRRARDAGMALTRLHAIVVTHEHGDHARGAIPLAGAHGVPVVATAGTLECLDPGAHGVSAWTLVPHEPLTVGPFEIMGSPTSHDAAEPVAVTVSGPRGLKVGVACDLGRPTAAVRYLLRDCTALVVEANHDEVLLRTGPYPAVVRQRIAGSTGHLSNRAAAELIAELHHPGLRAVVLAHLSERCNRPEMAREAVAAALATRGFDGELLVADQRRPVAVGELVGGRPAA